MVNKKWNSWNIKKSPQNCTAFVSIALIWNLIPVPIQSLKRGRNLFSYLGVFERRRKQQQSGSGTTRCTF